MYIFYPLNVRAVSHSVFCSFLLLLSHAHSVFNFQVPRCCEGGFSRVPLREKRLLILGGSIEFFFFNLLIGSHAKVCVITCMDSNFPGDFLTEVAKKTVCERKYLGAVLTEVYNYAKILLWYSGFLNTAGCCADKDQSIHVTFPPFLGVCAFCILSTFLSSYS